MTASMLDQAFAEYDANPPRRARHRAPRAPLADRLTVRGWHVVTVTLTLATAALVIAGSLMLGGAR